MIDFFKVFFMYIVGFIFIYQPGLNNNIILFFSIFLLLLLILVLYCLVKYGKNFIYSIFTRQFRIFILGIVLASAYFAWRALSTGNNPRIFQNLLIIIQIFALLVVCFVLNKSFKYDRKQILTYFLNMGVIQCFIAIIMLIFSNLHNIALHLYYASRVENDFISSVRIYGLSSDYTFFTPIFHGILGIVALCLALEFGFKYLLYIPPLSLIILLNGRTGFLLFIIGGMVALVILSMKNTMSLIKGLFVIVSITILGGISVYFIYENSPATFAWISSGFQDLLNFFNGEKTGNFATLHNMMVFPTGINLLFGMGFRLYDNTQGFLRSDIGYVNDLFMGGLVYVSILYITIIRTLLYGITDTKKVKDPFYKINVALSISFILVLLLANYKGEVMRSGLVIAGMFVIKHVILFIQDGDKIND